MIGVSTTFITHSTDAALDSSLIVAPSPPPSPPSKVFLFQQFFLASEPERAAEIQFCLQQNCSNPHIDKIFLLNERIYTHDTELMVTQHEGDHKIVQIELGTRLTYADVFRFIADNNTPAYILLANADIFFDESLSNLTRTDIHARRKMFALVRHEFRRAHHFPASGGVFPRVDSQDAWILHTNFCRFSPEVIALFDFPLGIPGCDNKLLYILKLMLRFEIYNTPLLIRAQHHHASSARDYHHRAPVPVPYCLSVPFGVVIHQNAMMMIAEAFSEADNRCLHDYISSRTATQPFLVPLLTMDGCLESAIATTSATYIHRRNDRSSTATTRQQLLVAMSKRLMAEKRLVLSSWSSVDAFAREYLHLFEDARCDIFIGGGGGDGGGGDVETMQQHLLLRGRKTRVMHSVLELYHYVHNLESSSSSPPWSMALRGKRLLFVCNIPEALMRAQWLVRDQLFGGVDLFPDCELAGVLPIPSVLERPPGSSAAEYRLELAHYFRTTIDAAAASAAAAAAAAAASRTGEYYDVALVSTPGCTGGFGNLICKHIVHNHGKSAINVGCFLPIYFGIVLAKAGDAWKVSRPDVAKLYMNPAWVGDVGDGDTNRSEMYKMRPV